MTTKYIVSSLNLDNYYELLSRFELQLDIYYQPDFLEIDAKIQNGSYEIFIVTRDKFIFIYPYIKLPFNNNEFKDFYDITSPYGYCGPFCNSELFFDDAESLLTEYLSKWCVSEFVRYHFSYNFNLKFKQNIINIHNRTIITLDLNQTWENIWMNEFSSTNRNLIRKLEKESFIYTETLDNKDLDDFVDMYYSTMKNANADSFYYFTKDLIKSLYFDLGDKIMLVKVEKEGVVYGYSLFFLSGEIATYYLSARNINFVKIPATNYLLSKTAELLKYKNINLINFGGGLTNESDDYLFKFKSNFSKTKQPFFIGKRIYNNEIYQKIVKDWILVHGIDDYESKKQKLQFYR